MIVPTKQTVLEDFGDLSPAEMHFLEKCSKGLVANFSGWKENIIRAELIRYMLLGGCDKYRPTEFGIFITGAKIIDQLNLWNCHSQLTLALLDCKVSENIFATFGSLGGLLLSGSEIRGLNAQGLDVKGSVFLRNGFRASSEVSFSNATIEGQLDCSGATFENKAGKALNAQSIGVKASVIFTKGFSALGEVSLSDATIGGSLDCKAACFKNEGGLAFNVERTDIKGSIFLNGGFKAVGKVSISGTTIGAQLNFNDTSFEHKKDGALYATNLNVKGPLFFQDVKCEAGYIDFSNAHVRVLSDEIDCWPEDRFFMDGFSYDKILGSDVSAKARLEWLTKQGGEVFSPQPYEQLAKVLGEMGHRRDRFMVLQEMEHRLREQIRAEINTEPDGTWHKGFSSLASDANRLFRHAFDFMLGFFVGYGYRPGNAFKASVALIFLLTVGAWLTWNAGGMVPNSPVILVNQEWLSHAADRKGNAAAHWTANTETGRDYETFNSFTYALDVFIPIIDFGQESAWAPSTERGFFGEHLYWLRWVFKALGWIITALGAAALTGIIRQDR